MKQKKISETLCQELETKKTRIVLRGSFGGIRGARMVHFQIKISLNKIGELEFEYRFGV